MSERTLAGCYPPGELLKEELAARGWSEAHFAQLLGASQPTVQKILAARCEITAELARALDEVLGTGPEIWLNLERQFQLDKARKLRAGR